LINRALCKHSHRSSDGFWGLCRGSEVIKNEIALKKLQLIIDRCVWINIHKMGGLNNPNEIIIEIRVQEGMSYLFLFASAS
jgi:hypothetical protein